MCRDGIMKNMKSFYDYGGMNMRRIMILSTWTLCVMYMASCSGTGLQSSDAALMRITAVPDDSLSMTRSVLDETAAYEDMVTCITVAAFDNSSGYLVSCSHHESGNLAVNLPMDRTYRIFMLANMGDLSGEIPSLMKDMQSFRYDVRSYSLLKRQGLPMACSMVTPWAPDLTVYLQRLMAKLVITVDKNNISDMGGGGDEAFRNHKIAVNRVARILYPFASGGSSVRGVDDLFEDGDIEYETFADATAVNSEEIVLYVPENKQGAKLDEDARPEDKSESNEELSGAELCTYVSLDGYKDGNLDGVYGSFVYRFFPGSDNSSNFDLEGGKKYLVTLKLTWNGMFAEGDWKVSRSGWKDGRRLLISLEKDRAYGPDLSVCLARGSTDIPVYIYYSPHGEAYESEAEGGEPHHYSEGWMFRPKSSIDDSSGSSGPPAEDNEGEFIGSRMSLGFVGHTGYRTKHYVTIPFTTESGYANRIEYCTNDGREGSVLNIEVAEPRIDLTPESMLFLFTEYGYGTRRTIKVDPDSPVRACNIVAYTDDSDLITLGTFDPETGQVDVYWNDTNTTSSPKTAQVFFHSGSCGVTAVCNLTQQNKPGLIIGEDEDGGDGFIEY